MLFLYAILLNTVYYVFIVMYSFMLIASMAWEFYVVVIFGPCKYDKIMQMFGNLKQAIQMQISDSVQAAHQYTWPYIGFSKASSYWFALVIYFVFLGVFSLLKGILVLRAVILFLFLFVDTWYWTRNFPCPALTPCHLSLNSVSL